ncbi:XRE family transcriptional regulator [Labrys miyagiensis]|uniref:XRE family transcriptional regulator n=1 Tax=Labrys miyagiensis TaxID=346912 RepID=A0ABQ6CLG9_9HYPH|nr:XRE family transcriptional regulator [Labrys miyagiensis]
MSSEDFSQTLDPTVPRLASEVTEADVRVGRRIRALRLERNLGLIDVAQRAGISVGALSQIERGLSSLRVRVLWPLAAALDVEPHSLLVDGADQESDLYCVRSANRRVLPVWSEGIRKELLSPPGATLTGLLVYIEPGGGTAEAYAHAGHEFGLVRTGEVELTIDNVLYTLKAGDSFAFKSTLRHSFCNTGSQPCEIVWVNTVKPSEVRNGA